MGEPALQLLSTEAAVGEAAAKQTTRLIVIEGGKRAALATGEVAVSEGAVSAAARGAGLVLGSTAATVGAFLLALLWPSSLADGTLKQQPTQDANTASSAVPQANEKVIQECPGNKNCPPHDWVVSKQGKSVDEARKEAKERITELSKSPSQSDTMRGVVFERDAMELNNKKRPIETVGTVFKCRRCGVEQEVDIIFKDGQIAESKSANLKSVKKKSKQSQRLLDLQSFLNCNRSTNFQPLAKLDANHSEVDPVAQKYQERGYEIERLNTYTTR
ncbi:hypothetical protein [Hyalangium gracile]|uniref:hypothetical protein n=1 Tax=Hyalangium gracile TaxID=394092 RepID=UPI001CC940D2|nr:hypothetical protein [Hyalangium gracile]